MPTRQQALVLGIYQRLLVRCPRGIVGPHFLNVTLKGQSFELRIFDQRKQAPPNYSLRFYIPGHQYAFNGIMLFDTGYLEWDETARDPELKQADYEAWADGFTTPELLDVIATALD